MIRTAQIEDVEELKTIWSQIFGDEDELIENFFALFDEVDSLVYEEDGRIVSMLYMINTDTSGYLYGLATLPEYRGRGYMRKLLEYALNEAYEAECIFLMPAEKSLDKYYDIFGFKEKIAIYSYEYNKSFQGLHQITLDEIMELVTKDFECTNNFLRFGQNIIRYVLMEEEFEFYKVVSDGNTAGYVVVLNDRIKYYGMDRTSFEKIRLLKRVDAHLLVRGECGKLEGFIPF